MPMSQRASAMRTFALLAALIGFAAAQYPPMAPAFPPAPPNVNPYQVPLSSEQVDAGDLCPAVGSSGVLRCASTSVGPTVDGEPTVDQGWQSVGAGGSCVTFAGLCTAMYAEYNVFPGCTNSTVGQNITINAAMPAGPPGQTSECVLTAQQMIMLDFHLVNACTTDACNAPAGDQAPEPAPAPPPIGTCPNQGSANPISCWFSNETADGSMEVVEVPMASQGPGAGSLCFTLVGKCNSANVGMSLPGCNNQTIDAPVTVYVGMPGPSNESVPMCNMVMGMFGELGFTSGTACATDGCNAPPGAAQQQKAAVEQSQQAQQQAQQGLQSQSSAEAVAVCPAKGSATDISCFVTNTSDTGAATVELADMGVGGLCITYIGTCTSEVLAAGLPGCADPSDVGNSFSLYGSEQGPSSQSVSQCQSDIGQLLSTGLFNGTFTTCVTDACNAPPDVAAAPVPAMSRQVAQQEGNQVSNSVSQAAQSTAAQAQAEAVATCPTQGAAGIISCYLMVPGTTQNNAPPQYTVQSVPLTNTGGICLTYADVCTSTIAGMELNPWCNSSSVGEDFATYTFFEGTSSVQACQSFLTSMYSLGSSLQTANATACITDNCNAPPGMPTGTLGGASGITQAVAAANPPPPTVSALAALLTSPPPPHAALKSGAVGRRGAAFSCIALLAAIAYATVLLA